ncbi:MAG: stage II sporulation protein D [Clostridia bacterium]|nr:stage II sporulation protein D [Clostridia bacterium]
MKPYFYPFYILLAVVMIPALWLNFNHIPLPQEKKDESISEPKTVKVYYKETGEVKDCSLDEYLYGVLPAEMPPSFNDEALKAQAVAARTYVINRMKNGDKSAHNGGDICTDSTHCQAYIKDSEATERFGAEWEKTYRAKIKNAVDSTKGEIITYENEPITAVFHSTAGGYTENSEDVWSGYLPYLRSVKSEGDELSPSFSSVCEVPVDGFKDVLRGLNPAVNFDTNPLIGNALYNQSGSIKSIILGGCSFKGTDIRSAFQLKSANFSVSEKDNKIIFNVKGNGHGVGMSQYGANYKAAQGATYKDIINTYYKDVSLTKAY